MCACLRNQRNSGKSSGRLRNATGAERAQREQATLKNSETWVANELHSLPGPFFIWSLHGKIWWSFRCQSYWQECSCKGDWTSFCTFCKGLGSEFRGRFLFLCWTYHKPALNTQTEQTPSLAVRLIKGSTVKCVQRQNLVIPKRESVKRMSWNYAKENVGNTLGEIPQLWESSYLRMIFLGNYKLYSSK